MIKTPLKQDVKISKELRDIIHGYIMSDGHVNPAGALTVDQSDEQEKFVQWLYLTLHTLRTTTPIRTVLRPLPPLRGGGGGKNIVTMSKRFNTRALLKGFRNMWYQPVDPKNPNSKKKKQLPKSLDCFFNSNFLTIWFAGDGTKMLGSQGAKFEVTSYTPAERERLKALFKKKFDLDVVIARAGKSITGTDQYTININAPDYEKFRNLITESDLIPTLFPNKLCKKKGK